MIRGPWLILCEGEGDAAFLRHLIAERNLPNFDIRYPTGKEPGGKYAFGKRLDALRAEPDFERLTAVIVVSDNDDDPDTSFQSIIEQIRWAGYGIPDEPLQIARAANFPALVVIMLPWVSEPGNLETLCLRAAYDQWPHLKACLDEYCRCAHTDRWGMNKQSKMRLRSLLSAACEADPNTSLVHAWSNARRGNLIPLGHACFDQLANFLREFGVYLHQH